MKKLIVPKTIDFSENKMTINEHLLTFPLSIDELSAILGEYKEYVGKKETRYIFHESGLVFETCDQKQQYLKSRKAYVDDAHNIVCCCLYYGKKVTPMWNEQQLPSKNCTAILTFAGKPINTYFRYFDRDTVGSFSAICWSKVPNVFFDSHGNLTDPLSISFTPKRLVKPANYKIKQCNEDVLEFANFNFKLAVLQELIYELECLEPYFDLDDFAFQYKGKKINTESEVPIKAVVNFFKKLQIPKSLSKNVVEIYMDGGNKIYSQIAPLWDGEDDIFDINDITKEDIEQLPNLKKATVLSSNYDIIAEIFKQAGVEVKPI